MRRTVYGGQLRKDQDGNIHCAVQDGQLRRVSSWNGILHLVRQLKTERALRKRQICFRTTEPNRAAEAYGSMSEEEFNSINGPQEWQNRRLIPRVIESLRLGKAVLAIDLGCGSGHSSQVLGSQLPPGSMLFGYDICESLLERASHRTYCDVLGTPIEAYFMNQSILEPLRDPGGRRLDAASVGLMHAAGVIGHHLREADVREIASEMARVLAPTGSAVLDTGPAMPRGCLQEILAEYGFAVWDTFRAVPYASHQILIFRRCGWPFGREI
jgi:SAM-dependent methyltransferase